MFAPWSDAPDTTSSLSKANKLLIRCAWRGNPAFDSLYGTTWAPGNCPCTGTRALCNRKSCNPRQDGRYITNGVIPGWGAGPGSKTGNVTKVVVTFGKNAQTAFDDEYRTGKNPIVPYKLETVGCTYGNASYYFKPRPVTYQNGVPVNPRPTCNYNEPKDRKEEVKGQFDDSTTPPTFIPVSDVSDIFKFTWCPNEDQFHVTVFRSGNYVFTHHTGLELLQAEIEQHETTVAAMQAEIDQLQADKTGTIKVVFV